MALSSHEPRELLNIKLFNAAAVGSTEIVSLMLKMYAPFPLPLSPPLFATVSPLLVIDTPYPDILYHIPRRARYAHRP